MHTENHPNGGQTVLVRAEIEDPIQGEVVGGAEFVIEGWWDQLTGVSWMYSDGNFAAMHYALRTGANQRVPVDDEVLYGKIGSLGHLVHVSELVLP